MRRHVCTRCYLPSKNMTFKILSLLSFNAVSWGFNGRVEASIECLTAFLLAISIVFSALNIPQHESLLTQHHPSSQFTSLASNEATNWLLPATVRTTTSAFNTCHLYYIPALHHVSFTLPTSISYHNLTSTLLLPLVLFDILAILFRIPSLRIWNLLPLTLPSNLILKLIYFLVLPLYWRASDSTWCRLISALKINYITLQDQIHVNLAQQSHMIILL